jgi:hypothetical protein
MLTRASVQFPREYGVFGGLIGGLSEKPHPHNYLLSISYLTNVIAAAPITVPRESNRLSHTVTSQKVQ